MAEACSVGRKSAGVRRQQEELNQSFHGNSPKRNVSRMNIESQVAEKVLGNCVREGIRFDWSVLAGFFSCCGGFRNV